VTSFCLLILAFPCHFLHTACLDFFSSFSMLVTSLFRSQDDSTNNIIPGHCRVSLLFPSLFSSCWFRSDIPFGQRLVHDTFTLDHPQVYLLLLLLFPVLLFASFFLLHERWYNETGLLIILPVTVSVCLGALRTPRFESPLL